LNELLFDNETEQSIAAALTAHDLARHEAGATEAGAREWIRRRDALYLEWLTITGRLVDDLPR